MTDPSAKRTPPRSALADWSAPSGRDPVAILEADDAGRVDQLLALRWQRLTASPFAFFRGSASVMATDLANVPSTDLFVQAVGDAHLMNFGLFGTSEQRLLFDLNDFDEAARAPFEWDVRRLATSVVVAGRAAGHASREALAAAQGSAGAYRFAMRRIAEMPYLDAWYLRVDLDDPIPGLPAEQAATMQAVIDQARRRNATRAVARHTVQTEVGLRLREDPPLLVRVPLAETDLREEFGRYLDSLPIERRTLLERYRPIDVALKVVGVGSVGTRCLVALLQGRGPEDALILQVKEAGRSVLERATGVRYEGHQGERVVEGQRLLQAAGDPFLGWSTDVSGRAFYWRQLWNMKGSFDVERFSPADLAAYAQLCGAVLARGHARTAEAAAIAAYLGASDRFDRAIATFAHAYADQAERDYALVRAAADRRTAAAS